MTHLCHRWDLRSLDGLHPPPLNADEENGDGLGHFRPSRPLGFEAGLPLLADMVAMTQSKTESFGTTS